MATSILSRVLQSLQSIYSFPNAQKSAPGDIELDLPIQPVHDVSKLSHIGSALGPLAGWWIGSTIHTHAAVGTITSTPSPYDGSGAGTSSSYPASISPFEYHAFGTIVTGKLNQ